MPYLIGLLIALAGVGYIYRHLTQNQAKIEYPAPHTLIIEPLSEHPTEDRLITLEGGVNFRDIGGYRNAEGQSTRWGKVYRSGSLSRLTPADWQRIAEMGVRFVCDLRADEETEADPDIFPQGQGIRYLHNPVIGEASRWERLQALFLNKRRLATLLTDAYTRLIIDQNGQVIGGTLKPLAQPDNLPAIIHCTAGKDRTGVAIALLLSLLGVPDEVITADYSLSNHYYDFFYEVAEVALRPVLRFGFTPEDVMPLLSADSRAMQFTLDYTRQHYGSIEDYLKNQAGLNEEDIASIRANLLE